MEYAVKRARSVLDVYYYLGALLVDFLLVHLQHNVVIIVWEKEKLVTTRIKYMDVADSYRSYFEVVWKQARR